MPWPETDLVWTFCETPQNHLVDFLTPLHKLQSEKGKDYFHRRKICLWHQRHFSAILRFANTQSRRISAVTHIKIFSAEHAQTKCPSAILQAIAGSCNYIFKMAAQPSENELDFPFNSNREFELKLGSSFHSKGGSKTAFHTIRCKFDFLTLWA